MKRKCLNMILVLFLSVMVFCGCQKTDGQAITYQEEQTEPQVRQQPEEQDDQQTQEQEKQPSEAQAGQRSETKGDGGGRESGTTVRVASLKGPTTMGLVRLWQLADEGGAEGDYEFQMMTGADEIMPRMLKGEVDIALIPANAAAILYEKSQGAVSVIDINTLGVLYLVSGDHSIERVEDLKGKTVYLTGKGTTPDYVLRYLLSQHKVDPDSVNLEYRSEPTEVAALLKENPDCIGLLPQPFVTAACMQNETLSVVLDIDKEWAALNDGQGVVTGVTVVRKDFLKEHPETIDTFLKEHQASAQFANDNVEEAAEMVVKRGIVEKAPIAAKAIPACHITFMKGEEMKEALSEYLEILFEQDPEFIGGAMPEEDFYEVR